MGDLKLGDCHLVKVQDQVWVAHLVAQSRAKGSVSGIRLPKLQLALEKVTTS